MPGELWRQKWQIGKETTYGTAVPATRVVYFEPDSVLTRERQARPHAFATGTRDNVRDLTLGPVMAGGKVSMPLSSSEIVELLLMSVRGGVTPTGAGAAKLWTFTPGTSLDSATLEFQDGAIARRLRGAVVDTLTIAGSVDAATTVSAEVLGADLAANALTGSLSDRTPDFIEGWETKLYLDGFGATPGTTVVAATMLNWEVALKNNLIRKYFADNTQAAGAVVTGALEVTAKLTIEAAASAAATEFANWDAATKRLLRLEFGQNVIIAATDKKFVTVDVPGAWSAFDLGQTASGTRVYALELSYVYDPTNAFGLQIRAQNARATAW